MKESELRILFLRIANFYSGFSYDDFKVEEWLELLRHVSFERAADNLAAYTLNPNNEFPPHPGILAASIVQRSSGPVVLDATETRSMLENYEQESLVRMPDHVKEAAKRIAESSIADRTDDGRT